MAGRIEDLVREKGVDSGIREYKKITDSELRGDVVELLALLLEDKAVEFLIEAYDGEDTGDVKNRIMKFLPDRGEKALTFAIDKYFDITDPEVKKDVISCVADDGRKEDLQNILSRERDVVKQKEIKNLLSELEIIERHERN